MMKDNHTTVTEFLLMGFQNLHSFHIPLFLLLIFLYSVTVTGNLLIIMLVSVNQQLKCPMYFFLSHLSLCDILISSNVGPNTLQVILTGRCPISALGCLIQLYFFGASALIECCLLTVMSYDRYLAICNPLRYPSIMNVKLPYYLAIWCWTAGFALSFITEVLVFELEFCGPNIIDHFFCDLAPLLELSCSDTSLVEIQVSINVILIVISQLVIVVATYICIFSSIFRISTSTGRQKTFSTCSSHLAVVSIYYGTLITLYMAPSRGYSLELNKALSLLNTVLTPLFNPIIYSLRNKDIRKAIIKFLMGISSVKLKG
ncbi:olfactory receptor 5AS1-like [Spea bombifrons]|uniref:olfactory receptor 5AS1-like n=1 Tax=Spea bombifrons TaxID=233779 RepID=UPI0023492BAF|nr:olfactory receptor 5AS1-like [Spea bombifrons]